MHNFTGTLGTEMVKPDIPEQHGFGLTVTAHLLYIHLYL